MPKHLAASSARAQRGCVLQSQGLCCFPSDHLILVSRLKTTTVDSTFSKRQVLLIILIKGPITFQLSLFWQKLKTLILITKQVEFHQLFYMNLLSDPSKNNCQLLQLFAYRFLNVSCCQVVRQSLLPWIGFTISELIIVLASITVCNPMDQKKVAILLATGMFILFRK